MPRRTNPLPTTIYWLYDVRPETLAQCPEGRPFYCGKTVQDTKRRFEAHRHNARKYPDRAISRKINECGDLIRIHVVEVVPADGDWIARERFWIRVLRILSHSEPVNVSDGGAGPTGLVHTPESRAKMSASKMGTVLSDEHRAKIGAAHKGKFVSDETRARIGRASANRSPETLAKLSAWQIGRKLSAEHRAKVSAAMKGRFVSAETRVKMSIASKNRSPEARARQSERMKGRVFSPETIAKMSAAQSRRYQRLREANARA